MTIKEFAYLREPSKIRAAIINAGGPRLSVDVIERKLVLMGNRREARPDVGEPTDSDGDDFRVTGYKLPDPVKPKGITEEERKRIAKLAALIGDKPEEPQPEKQKTFRYKAPLPHYGGTAYAAGIIAQVCEALEIPREAFSSESRQKYLVAARALVVKLLRERNASIYSYPRIAEIVGRGDHSTMINAMRKFEIYCRLYPEIAALYLQMREGGE